MPTATDDVRELRMVWSPVQAEVIHDETRYLDVEGAVRSGKTTCVLWKILMSCVAAPGISWLACRWTDDALRSIMRPIWRDEVCAKSGITPTWNGDEHCYKFDNGSRVYMKGLKPSEDRGRYSKIRGLTLAGIYVDQAEELSHDYYQELKSRLSQYGYPQQLIISPNPPMHGHWITEEFPEDNDHPHHKLVRFTIYDNRAHLGEHAIEAFERAYPPGNAKRRPLLEGRRGLNVVGDEVYKGYFSRDKHVRQVRAIPNIDLLEAIDFGKHHPCVVWSQLTPYGGLSFLGGVMGQDMLLADFLPIVHSYRRQWFPSVYAVRACCDPAGTHATSHGTIRGIDVLRDHGVEPVWQDNSNTPAQRRAAIETLGGYMRRDDSRGEPAFAVDPQRWVRVEKTRAPSDDPFLANGFEAGYVWDPHRRMVGNKSVVLPLKDGWFEHAQNCAEYTVLNFGRAVETEGQVQRRVERQVARDLRAAQRDSDPADLVIRFRRQGRGGY